MHIPNRQNQAANTRAKHNSSLDTHNSWLLESNLTGLQKASLINTKQAKCVRITSNRNANMCNMSTILTETLLLKLLQVHIHPFPQLIPVGNRTHRGRKVHSFLLGHFKDKEALLSQMMLQGFVFLNHLNLDPPLSTDYDICKGFQN